MERNKATSVSLELYSFPSSDRYLETEYTLINSLEWMCLSICSSYALTKMGLLIYLFTFGPRRAEPLYLQKAVF